MRKIIVPLVLCTLMACNGKGHGGGTGTPDPAYIPVDSANKMIGSYLNSIKYQTNDTDLHSIILDANVIRNVLTDSRGQAITHMKVMFGHTLSYINGGGQDQPCGYKSGALTIILAGYDDKGNYIYVPMNKVMDNGLACPANCPSGPAGDNFLPQ